LKNPDLWLLSRLQQTVETYTAKLETCEFNVALAALEDAVIEDLSRLYVPMVRKELWSDDSETLGRRLAVYSTLWHVLKTVTLLFNPITPYLSEALHRNIYRRLDPSLPETVNLEKWPKPNEELRNKQVEEDFETLFNIVSLAYSARQSARLKRRWPLSKMVIVAPEEKLRALKKVEDLLLELTNGKAVHYTQKPPREVSEEGWASATENDAQAFVDIHRDQKLLGEGVMRDLARRVQALRKELGYKPTDVLDAVQIAELDKETTQLLQPYLSEMKELTRTKKINLPTSRKETSTDWHEFQLDEKKIYIAIDAGRKEAADGN